ncbi:MAG: ATP-binding protein [Verrucomicrobiae bacterium]|nr:ATP-binding protein [Verrucomicrobiae bacterium]
MNPAIPSPVAGVAPLPILAGDGLFWQMFREGSDIMLLLEVNQLSIVDLNESAEKLMGYSRAELLNRCFVPSLSQTQRLYVNETQRLQAIMKALNSSKRFSFTKSNGITMTAAGKASLINLQGINYILIAIKAESEERKHEKDLRQMEKLAALGQTVAGVAHEINNPLMVIKMRLELLKRQKELPANVQSTVKEVDAQVDRISRIVKDFLSFARKDTSQRVPTVVTDVITKAIEHRREEITLSNIEIIEDFEANPPQVACIPSMLEQVFLNIINNAVYALQAQQQPGRLTIKTRNDGANVQVMIVDSGPGIPEEHLAHIFEPFFTTKEVGKGTGLGLSICYSIVMDFGGQMSVWNEPGAGAAFMIELPIYDPQAAQAA